MPVTKKYPVQQILDACGYYVRQTGRRVTFEWALISGVNDTPEQARRLAAKLGGLLCHVNAIPLNPTEGFRGVATTRERAAEFKGILDRAGIPCTVRLRRGIEIQAGCGQLAVIS
jgi:23S rRNA (adenine2503-C2)-methyltransferase